MDADDPLLTVARNALVAAGARVVIGPAEDAAATTPLLLHMYTHTHTHSDTLYVQVRVRQRERERAVYSLVYV